MIAKGGTRPIQEVLQQAVMPSKRGAVVLSAVLRGEKTIRQMGSELIGFVADVASGRMTKAEAFGFSDIAVDHVCRFV
jgi:altronate dehydratase